MSNPNKMFSPLKREKNRAEQYKVVLLEERKRLVEMVEALEKISLLPAGDCLADPVVLGTHLNMARNYAANALKSK